jgi:hypothetical protein
MKQVVRIDSEGFYVEPVILEDNDKEVRVIALKAVLRAFIKRGTWAVNGAEGASQAEIDALTNTPQPIDRSRNA